MWLRENQYLGSFSDVFKINLPELVETPKKFEIWAKS